MSKVLIDYNNQDIVPGDIIKRENMKTNEKMFFKYVSLTDINGTLYVYSKNKDIDTNNIDNININNGVSLLNNDTYRWSKVTL